MTAWLTLLLILRYLALSTAQPKPGSAVQCPTEFPLRETVSILEKIKEKYGIRKAATDENGDEWTSVLIPEEADVEIGGKQYRLNAREHSASTFYFHVLQLSSEAVYVVPKEVRDTWSPRFPDKTFLLGKISFDCASDEVACGLRCCSCSTRDIQEQFLEVINEKRKRMRRAHSVPKYYNNYQIEKNGTEYSLEPKEGLNCLYRLSQFDKLYQKRASYNIMTDTIYYKCPEGTHCCSLECVPDATPPTMSALHSSQAWMRSKADVCRRFFTQYEREVYILLTVAFALVFITIAILHCKRCREESAKPGRISRENRYKTTDTQTSRLTLEDCEEKCREILEKQPLVKEQKHVVIVIPEKDSQIQSKSSL